MWMNKVFYCSLILFIPMDGAGGRLIQQKIVEAGSIIYLDCPKEHYTEYYEGLGTLIPPGNYTQSKWMLLDCFHSASMATKDEAFSTEDYKGKLRGRGRLFVNGTLKIFKVDQRDAGVYLCYKWVHSFGKDRTYKTLGHLELIVAQNGTEFRNPEGECKYEAFGSPVDFPHPTSFVCPAEHIQTLRILLTTFGITTLLLTCVIICLLLKVRIGMYRPWNVTSSVAYKKLSSQPKLRPQDNTHDEVIYEEINNEHPVITKAQLLELLGLPKDYV